jgi:hypothetical protein
MIPIFIPTKGRCKKQRTAGLLRSIGVEYTLVVEPQEAHLYGGHKIVTLPENNRGLAYSRNHILSINAGMFGMFDDDVVDFGVVVNGRCKSEAGKLIEFVSLCESVGGYATYCPAYRQFAWSSKKPYRINKPAEVMGIYDSSIIASTRYDACAFPEDRDFFLSLVLCGKKTIAFPKYWFSTPHVGSVKGGLQSDYASGRYVEGAENLKSKWGDLVTLKKRGWRLHKPGN